MLSSLEASWKFGRKASMLSVKVPSHILSFSPVYTEEQLKRGHPLVDSNLHFLRNIAIHFTYIGFSYSYCIVVCRHVMIVFT